MKITTKFSIGDKAWTFNGDHAQQLTIGQVRVEITDSPGVAHGSMFDNYSRQKSRKEQYMCVETGIGSGSIYTLGEHIFETEAECLLANADRIAEREAKKERQRQYEEAMLLAEEENITRKLARIEEIRKARQS